MRDPVTTICCSSVSSSAACACGMAIEENALAARAIRTAERTVPRVSGMFGFMEDLIGSLLSDILNVGWWRQALGTDVSRLTLRPLEANIAWQMVRAQAAVA
jgi:hypothetical protein